jgi:hypothetical protein
VSNQLDRQREYVRQRNEAKRLADQREAQRLAHERNKAADARKK